MKVTCTGLVTSNGTRVLQGAGTKFLTELRPYDRIQVGSSSTYVQAIVNDSTIICEATVTSAINVKLFITVANPAFLLPVAVPAYQLLNTNLGDHCVYGGQLYGGQASNNYYDRRLSTLNSSKSLTLPSGYNYYTPYTDFTLVSTSAGSTLLTVADLSTVVATTAGSNKITYVSGSGLLLTEGARVVIDSIKYTVSKIVWGEQQYGTYWANQNVYLDKAVTKTFRTAYMTLDTDLAAIFPQGSKVLLNGKLYTIAKSNGSYLQVKYPISDTGVVSLRRPLMAAQTGVNTLEFFNLSFNQEYLKPGNLVIVQDFRSEDELYSVNSAYTEIKHVARLLDTSIAITVETHKYNFSGIACFGVPNNGLYSYPIVSSVQSGYSGLSIQSYDTSYAIASIIGEYIILNDYVCTVKSIPSSRTLFINESIPVGYYNVRVPLTMSPPSYTPQIINLCLKLAADIISTGIKQTATLDGLMAKYLFCQDFAYNAFAARPTIHNVYSPELFAVNRNCVPPHKIDQTVAVYQSTPYGSISQDNAVMQCLGLPLATVRN